MKKKFIFKIITIILLITTLKVNAKNFSDASMKILSNQTSCLEEEIIPEFTNNTLTAINIIITIPKDCTEEELIISPSILESIKQYSKIKPGDNIDINLKIDNKSNYNYNYINNSFILSTENLERLGIKENLIDTKAIGFDSQKIYEISTIYRTINTPIISLYNYNSQLEDKDLSDINLDKKLKEKGYTGIDELDNYYLDFYNTKYNLNEKSLSDLTYSTIKDLFKGKITTNKETNSNIIKLSYDYFYNKLLSFNFKEQKADDYNSEDYSIGTYMRTSLGNAYLNDKFMYIRSNTYSEIENMSLKLNKEYTTSSYNDYNYYIHLEFKLKKEVDEIVNTLNDNDIIIPPNTGIE